MICGESLFRGIDSTAGSDRIGESCGFNGAVAFAHEGAGNAKSGRGARDGTRNAAPRVVETQENRRARQQIPRASLERSTALHQHNLDRLTPHAGIGAASDDTFSELNSIVTKSDTDVPSDPAAHTPSTAIRRSTSAVPEREFRSGGSVPRVSFAARGHPFESRETTPPPASSTPRLVVGVRRGVTKIQNCLSCLADHCSALEGSVAKCEVERSSREVAVVQQHVRLMNELKCELSKEDSKDGPVFRDEGVEVMQRYFASIMQQDDVFRPANGVPSEVRSAIGASCASALASESDAQTRVEERWEGKKTAAGHAASSGW
eukprot:TRINITY_DN76171_c0_g1_i1.p1 TRINITY_DN76171_c0_g1~~TRINITY_DN76171_c0_g1_i1.p1  ORF type:complete len:319 (+),score=43.41 TRINITY_DN76171_c0_g1_i1:78-1034(+)